MKTCITCKKTKERSEFFFRNKTKGYLQSRCKQCFMVVNNALKKKNQERTKQTKRREYLKNKDRYKNSGLIYVYGITLDQYRDMLEKQGRSCRICKSPVPAHRHLDVDHCHSTGKVRGLLCSACNRLLSNCFDDTSILSSAITYLDESKK